MSSGPDYPKINLIVTEFRPLNVEFLAFNVVGPGEGTDGECQRFTPSYAPPFGLHDTSPEDLKSMCLNHIKSIIKQERDVGEANHGDISIISWKVFEAVNRYRRSSGGTGNVSHFSHVSM